MCLLFQGKVFPFPPSLALLGETQSKLNESALFFFFFFGFLSTILSTLELTESTDNLGGVPFNTHTLRFRTYSWNLLPSHMTVANP